MNKLVSFTYTNYRNETSKRIVLPEKMWFGSTDYHKQEQWLMSAFDLAKQDYRDFAMSDITDLTNIKIPTTGRFNCKEPNESNGPKANTETVNMMICLHHLCNEAVDGDSDYCFTHKHSDGTKTCQRTNCFDPAVINLDYCPEHKLPNIPTDTEKGKELNKTLKTPDATNSNNYIDNIPVQCKEPTCSNQPHKPSDYCTQHNRPIIKYKHSCKECNTGYNKTTNPGFCSNTCQSDYRYKHDD